MEQLTARPSGRNVRRRRLLLPLWVLVAIVLVVTLIVTATRWSSSGTVDGVTIVNPTDYTVAVEVGGARGGWTELGYATRHGTTTLHGVADQGETWRFRFRSQGADGGGMSVSRDQLAHARWTVRVPDAVQGRLRAAGAPPSV